MPRVLKPAAICLVLLASMGQAWADDFDAAAVEFFESSVRPLLVERCHKCHGDIAAPKGGLKLTSRAAVLTGGDSGAAAIAGKAHESLLVEAIEYRDSLQMPPDAKLNEQQIEVLRKWVSLGLPWSSTDPQPAEARANATIEFTEEQRNFWSFQPVRVVPPAEVRDTNWPKSALDRYILAGIEQNVLKPSPAADKRTLLRRATFDLTGLPPSPAEMKAFLADESPDAFARVVDRLLASPAYGERWGRHWLDVVRYADCKDLRDIGQPYDIVESYRYRDWVVSAFNRDLPYDQFVVEQIAGDLLPAREPGAVNAEGIVATGMLTIGPWGPGDADAQKMHTDMVDDQINVVSRAMLGLTIGCARCHDHKFDPIPTADYYSLAGIFFSTQIAIPQISAPYNKVPLVPKDVVTQTEAHVARTAQLEKQLATSRDEQFALLAKGSLAHTGRYLLAAWDYQHRSQDKAAQTAPQFAQEQGLRPDALPQWIDYLGFSSAETRLLNVPLRDHGATGVYGWKTDRAEPILLVNTNDQPVNVPGTIAARGVAIHPGPTAGVAIAWRSTRQDRVRVRGSVTDAHAACGNGIDWTIEHRKPTSTLALASGSIANGGKQAFEPDEKNPALESVTVEPGDYLQIAVFPKGEYSCDLTGIEFEIASLGEDKRSWNVADIVDDVLDNGKGNPHRDSRGEEGVWHFLDLDTSHGPKRADAGPSSPLAPWFATAAKVESGTATRDDLDQVARDLQSALDSLVASAPANPAANPAPLAGWLSELAGDKGPFRAASRDESLLPAPARDQLAALASELQLHKKSTPPPIPYAMAASEGGAPGTKYAGFNDAPIHVRGRYDRLGAVVPRRFPQILAGRDQPPITQGSGRLQLARWIARPDHPLTARVMVNRIWQHHFGDGLVRTPGNFGKLGEKPTHPELLDYLASEFVRSGWSIKAMHRLMMLSATYQQSSSADPQTLAADPDNRLLGRMNLRRLEAEGIRDSLLAISGRLDPSLGGRPTRELSSRRRTLYLMTVRSDKSGFPFLFDMADPENIVDERTVSTVAPQALFLLNNSFALEQVAPLAERILAEAGPSERERIELAYELLYARPPREDEIALGLKFLTAAQARSEQKTQAAWEQYCQALLCANEFVYVP
jgi:hypothetical protein